MPIFGVMRLTLERDGGSMRGEEDFFSVARTIPLVAKMMSATLLLDLGGY